MSEKSPSLLEEISNSPYRSEYIKLLFNVSRSDDEMLADMRKIDPETMNQLLPETGQPVTEPVKYIDQYDLHADAILKDPSVYYKVIGYVARQEVIAETAAERRRELQ
jgi:hypothetical protein